MHELTLFDRVAAGSIRYQYPIEHPVIVGDLADEDACARAMAGSQAVVHLGGRPFPIQYLPLDEEHPTDVEDGYSLPKHVGEDLLRTFVRAHEMRCYAIRPTAILRVERLAEHARGYELVGDWSSAVNGYIDIRDAAHAFRLCLEAAQSLPTFEAFFVNAADTWSLEDSREMVERLRPDLADLAARLVGRQSLISAAKAERCIGF
ncbi:MAG: NAD(P)-dependent oxidoreductase [Chloroflexota bacterium]|nr:MAG: NAD(P)-dependent oxidoreductase [Chloroflexota bacterium]